MKRITATLFLLTLSACAPILQEEYVVVVEESAPEPIIEAPPIAAEQRTQIDPECGPNGDGIGGTGCPVD